MCQLMGGAFEATPEFDAWCESRKAIVNFETLEHQKKGFRTCVMC